MGRVVGLEPTRNGATIRRVNHFTTPAIFFPIIGISPYDVVYCTIERNIRQIVFRKIFSSITRHKKILLQYIKRFIKGKSSDASSLQNPTSPLPPLLYMLYNDKQLKSTGSKQDLLYQCFFLLFILLSMRYTPWTTNLSDRAPSINS